MPPTTYSLDFAQLDGDDQDLNMILTSAEFDVLIQLVERGPIEDGEVISKSGRDGLLEFDLAAKILVKGEDGFQAATYKARRWYKAYFQKEFPTAIYVRDIAMARKIKRCGDQAQDEVSNAD